MLCPDSRDAHYAWKTLLDEPYGNGKTYGDYIDMNVSPFVLPYHVHSYQMTQIVPLLQDKCADDESTCQMEAYAELCWSHLGEILAMKDTSENDFMNSYWAPKVVSTLTGVTEDEIFALFSDHDSHDSDWRVREFWKYGASIGVAGAPYATVNGVMLDSYPTEEADWK